MKIFEIDDGKFMGFRMEIGGHLYISSYRNFEPVFSFVLAGEEFTIVNVQRGTWTDVFGTPGVDLIELRRTGMITQLTYFAKYLGFAISIGPNRYLIRGKIKS